LAIGEDSVADFLIPWFSPEHLSRIRSLHSYPRNGRSRGTTVHHLGREDRSPQPAEELQGSPARRWKTTSASATAESARVFTASHQWIEGYHSKQSVNAFSAEQICCPRRGKYSVAATQDHNTPRRRSWTTSPPTAVADTVVHSAVLTCSTATETLGSDFPGTEGFELVRYIVSVHCLERVVKPYSIFGNKRWFRRTKPAATPTPRASQASASTTYSPRTRSESKGGGCRSSGKDTAVRKVSPYCISNC
jgi:hypothetical protein